MPDLYQEYLNAENDIKSILGAQLMASTPQDYALMEGMIRSILEDWDSRGQGGVAFFIHVMASKCEQFYETVAQSMQMDPMELFRKDGRNGFTPEGLQNDN
jgi:hypothetical protein